MKVPIFITVIIVATAAGIGWHDYQRLVSIRETQATLVRKAAAVGISLDSAHPLERVRITKRERGNHVAEARLLAADYTEYYIELSALRKKGTMPDDATMQRITKRGEALYARLSALDAGQLKISLSDVRDSLSLDEDSRQFQINNLLWILGEKYPRDLLALLQQSPDLFKSDVNTNEYLMRTRGSTIQSAIEAWATSDPKGAIEWIRKHGTEFPELVTDNAKSAVIFAAAQKDPKFAFDHLADMAFKNPAWGVEVIAQSARTPEQRIATLATLRECLKEIPNDKFPQGTLNNVIRRMVNQAISTDGFKGTTKWIDDAGFSAEELVFLTNEIEYNSVEVAEIGQWVEWTDRTVPAGKADGTIRNLVNRWTKEDHQAAGNWLMSAPETPAKNVAIRSFAETVSKYEPEAATQWAMTLPAGEARETTLKTIYQNWPKDDDASKAAAAAFAHAHGIK